MILSLGLGEPNYVPDSLVGQATDSTDLGSFAFFQCYVRETMQFEIVCFFSVYQDAWCPLDFIAEQLQYQCSEIARPLSRLADTRLLDEQIIATGPMYRLTRTSELRRAAIRLGTQWSPIASYA
jgi:hypothetical protein